MEISRNLFNLSAPFPCSISINFIGPFQNCEPLFQQLASVVSEDLATTAADNLHASEARILVLYTGGTIGMRKIGPGR